MEKFPRLVGLLQPNGRIKRKSVEDKFRRFFRKGKFKKSTHQSFWKANELSMVLSKSSLATIPSSEVTMRSSTSRTRPTASASSGASQER